MTELTESRSLVPSGNDPTSDDMQIIVERFGHQNKRIGQPQRLISATDDVAAVRSWLRKYRDSPKTLRAMRKEAERFLLWVVYQKNSSLSSLTVDDIEDYKDFLAAPYPSDRWVSETKWPRNHESWRPFAGPLGISSQRYAYTAIGNLFHWLQSTGYLNGNPVSLVSKPKELLKVKLTRFLSKEAVTLAFEAARRQKDPRKASRDHFMLSLFYLTGLRTFEGTSANMRDIYVSDTGKRWLPVVGKGNKVREVPISDELYDDLREYREVFGLPREIMPGETTPLILSSRGPLRRASDSSVLRAIRSIMERTALLAEDMGMEHQAAHIREATTHWLRHSCFSHLVKATGDLLSAKDLAGHSSIKTTSIYLHADADQNHETVSNALSKS